MNTYNAIPLKSGRWAVEWSMDGVVVGLVPGTFENKIETLMAALNLARLEWAEGP